MPAPSLTPEQVAALPPQRPRWMCHAVAFLALVVMLALVLAARHWARGLSSSLWSDTVGFVPLVLLLPLLWRTATMPVVASLIAILVPGAFLFFAWQTGFRWTALPYRDWAPRRNQRELVRVIPGTAYHVVLQSDEVARVVSPA